MSALDFYLITLAVFACIDGVQALGFNLQFGYAGLINMAYMALVAIGAYATGIAELPSASASGGSATYIGGFGWAFPESVLFGIVVTVGFSALLALVTFRRIRHDYMALALIDISQGMLVMFTNATR